MLTTKITTRNKAGTHIAVDRPANEATQQNHTSVYDKIRQANPGGFIQRFSNGQYCFLANCERKQTSQNS